MSLDTFFRIEGMMRPLTNQLKGDQHMARQTCPEAANKRAKKSNQKGGLLPRNAPPIEVSTHHIGGRSDGSAKFSKHMTTIRQKMTFSFLPASLVNDFWYNPYRDPHRA